jgi:CRISPR/Cas system-associated endonuclease/helicase Cas3
VTDQRVPNSVVSNFGGFEQLRRSDSLARWIVGVLESNLIKEQKQAAMEIRLFAKKKSENRLKIEKSSSIKPLISLLSSSDLQLQENELENGVQIEDASATKKQRKA